MSDTQKHENQPSNLESEQVDSGTGTPTSASTPGATGSQEPSSEDRSAQEKRVSGQEVLDELGHLGAQFVEVAQAAWRSEQRKQLEAELKSGLATLARSMEEGFEKVGRSKTAQESAAKAREAAESVEEKVSESKTGQDLAQGLMSGLRALSQRLDKIADDLESQQSKGDAQAAEPTSDPPSAPTSSTEAQDIPINRDNE